MNSVTGIANSALNVYSLRQAVTANNVANINTEDFKPSRSVNQENPNGGVSLKVDKGGGGDTVELSREVTDMMSNSTGFKANLKTLQTQDEMTRELLNIKA